MVNCAKAAELATGAKLEFKEPRASLKAPDRRAAADRLMLAKIKAQGVTEKEIKARTISVPPISARSPMPIRPST